MMFKQKFAMKTLNTILITADQTAPLLSQEEKLIALGVLRDNGYILTGADIQKLLATDVSVETGREILNTVKDLRGGYANHSTLIGKFPLQNPDQWGRSLIAFVNFLSGYFDGLPTMLEEDKALYQLDEIGHLKYLTIADDITEALDNLFTTKIPLSLDHEQFITALYASKDAYLETVDASKIVLKEILARHIAMQLETGSDNVSARSAIDVLRAVALLSGEENAKLDSPFKVKSLSNSVRRKVIEVLDRVANIDDVASKKSMFKKLFKMLHVHEAKYSKYENIRNLAKELQSVNNPKTSRTVLYQLINGVGTEEGFDLILNNPSLFVRNLDAILRNHEPKSVIALFEQSLKTRDVETKLLLQILEHFRNRDVDRTSRAFTPKGKSTPVVVDKVLLALEQSVIDSLDAIIKNELKRQYRLGDKPFYEKAYIHPSLYKINLPKGLSSQDGLKTVARGSRVKLQGTGETLRLFVHWKDDCDIDLSATIYDKDLNQMSSHAYFGNTSGEWYEHSGDVRSAPDGGSEFIDVYLDNLPAGTRYVAMAINCYSGKAYDDIPELFAGYMLREDRLAGKKFEPKTVQDKFSITGGVNFTLSIVVDVETREVIMMNANASSGGGWSINNVNFRELMNAVLNHKYITVGDLIEMHTRYLLCEDEQLTMTEQELEDVVVFDEDYAYNVLDITANLI